jgi:coproporphyrinogen III oxidase
MLTTDNMGRRMEQMVRNTQDSLCRAVEEMDGTRFRCDTWTRAEGGGGESRVLQDGNVFEKAGVNVSVVSGKMSAEAARSALSRARKLPDGPAEFFATGISVVIHPHNPMAPSAHANYRYFELAGEVDQTTWWFGGGADLSPSYLIREDAEHFHRVHKAACDFYDPLYYPRFKKWCDDYFFIAHRQERRGVGGIFFDNLNDRNKDQLLQFVTSCARAFQTAYLPIIEKRKDLPFTETQKHWQGLRRGRYVEFNLLYDRGTSFGLRTGGRTESILMSLPLLGCWEEERERGLDSPEAKTVDVLRRPEEWV